MFEKILVPVDFSDASRAALGHASRLASIGPGRLDLLHVVEHLLDAHPPFWTGEVALAEQLHAQAVQSAEHSMRELVEGFEAGAGVRVEGTVSSGTLPDTIAERARSVGASLLVVSTHGRTGPSRWLMGSVSERLLRSAPCPVWVARGSSGGPVAIERILVATDLSDHSRRALQLAARLAKEVSARLEAVYAWSAPFYADGAVLQADLFERIRDSARRDLAEFVSTCGLPSGCDVAQTVLSGPPAASLCQHAEDTSAELLVMGTHGRAGVRRMVLGSVAEATVRYAPCTALVVP